MAIEQCYPFNLTMFASLAFDCFALDRTAPKYFGFAELISGLALTLVVWTVADLRYKFRIDTAVLPVRKASVAITLIVGILVLLTDHWRASQSRVPAVEWLTPESWQLLLGCSFFLVLAAWLWLAFLRPATFSPRNARKFAHSVNRRLIQGSPTELAIVGDELSRSVSKIVSYMPDRRISGNKIAKAQAGASWLLMAMGSPKFCRAVVEGSPRFIINLFDAVNSQLKWGDEINVIAKNIVTAAIENRNSFLYHEKDFYESGLEGVTRPVTTALCRSPELIRNIGTLLSPEYSSKAPWDIDQWKAYFRLVLQAFTVHVGGPPTEKPKSLHWAYLHLQRIYSDLTKDLNLEVLSFNDDLDVRLRALGALIIDMVMALDNLDKQGKDYANHASEDIAHIIFSLIEAASSVRKPRKVSRKIQHELVWDDILNSAELRTVVGQKVLARVYCMIFNSIVNSSDLNSCRLIGYCLNVMGFRPPKENGKYGSVWRDLHVDLISWVQRNIASLLKEYPRMVRECFVEGMSYDEKHNRLVIHYAGEDGGKDSYEYLEVAPPT